MSARHRTAALLLGCCFSLPAQAGLLLAIYDQALQRSPQWQSAESAHAAVLAAEPVAQAGLMPQIWVDGGYGRNRVDVHRSASPFIEDETTLANRGQAALRISQPLYDRGAGARIAQFAHSKEAADQHLLQARQNFILDIGGRYLRWLEAEATLSYADAHASALGQQLEQMRSREELGLATVADRLLVQAERDAAEAARLRAAAALRAAREGIREILGQVPEMPTPLRAPIPLADPEPARPEHWVALALEHHPEVVLARLNQQLTQAELREAQGRRWPTLALELEHAYNNTAEFQLGSEAETSRAELRLRIPLYDGGASGGMIAAAQSRLQQSEANWQSARRAAERHTRDAYDGVVTGVVQVRAARQALASAEAARAAIAGRYDTGLATLADALASAGQVRRAARDLAQLRHQYLLSRLQLAGAVGALDREALAAIDALLLPR